MRGFFKNFCIFFFSAVTLLMLGAGFIYKVFLPFVVSNKYVVNVIEHQASEILNADVKIEKPVLKTGSFISFTVKEVSIKKNNSDILVLTDIDTLVSLREIFSKKIVVKKVLASSIFADVDELTKILPRQKKKKKKEKKEPFIETDFYNVLMGVKKCDINYNSQNFDFDLKARHMIFDRTQDRKYLHFDFDFTLSKAGHKIEVSANDMNKIFMENHKAYIDNFLISIENSKIIINASLDPKYNYELKISGDNFSASDIHEIVISNIFVANGREIIAPIQDVNGSVDFEVTLTNKTTKGSIDVNEVNFKVNPLLNLPVKVNQGHVDIGQNDIVLKDFHGFYNNIPENKFKFKGHINDYTNTCDTEITAGAFITNDFFKNYLSKMLGSPVELVGKAASHLVIKSKNGSCDLLWYFALKEGMGFKFGDQSMVLKDYKTMFKVDLSILKNILKINTINYYISSELKKGIKPLLTINGNVDMADNMKYLDLNLDIPKPLPSEFLNFLLGQKIFKKGEVSGQMYLDNHGKVPFMKGEFKLDKVLIPAQRMYIKKAELKAEGNSINISSNGRFRRSSYDFTGLALNEVRLPIIFKNMNLKVDNVDVEKILEQPPVPQDEQNPETALVSKGIEDEENSNEIPPFPKGLVIIEKCGLDLTKGVYKEINFGNMHADMTLDKDGILKLQSNKFDIADGTSAVRVNADLVKRNYYLRLGIKDVDSNIMATSILGLPRQISGKAMGLIELNTDETLKLNGEIKFKIKNGTIEQVGYVEYILKVASLFRNPLAMISPSLVVDLVNIPDGKFDEIQGEMRLKDNIVDRMKIVSTADELATLIFGRYDLTDNDATLRIYTKFSDKGKGFAGALRNISLNSLASKISISSRNESNYFANELSQIPVLKSGEERAQVFLTKVDGDVINFNFLSSLKRIK